MIAHVLVAWHAPLTPQESAAVEAQLERDVCRRALVGSQASRRQPVVMLSGSGVTMLRADDRARERLIRIVQQVLQEVEQQKENP